MTLPAYKKKGTSRVALVDSDNYQLSELAATISLTNAGPPTNGTSGTGFGVAQPGTLLIDITNGVVYRNTNTLASPTWTPLAGGIEANTVATGLTASTTHTQVGALALTAKINRVTVAVGSGDAVRLAVLTPGQSQTIYNDGASPIAVYPATGGAIDGGSANASVTLTNAKRATFTCTAANVINSAQLGVVSA